MPVRSDAEELTPESEISTRRGKIGASLLRDICVKTEKQKL
jgi:hypothetical protein